MKAIEKLWACIYGMWKGGRGFSGDRVTGVMLKTKTNTLPSQQWPGVMLYTTPVAVDLSVTSHSFTNPLGHAELGVLRAEFEFAASYIDYYGTGA